MRSSWIGTLVASLLVALIAVPASEAATTTHTNYAASKILVGGRFVHGLNMRISVSPFRKYPTVIDSDCSGSLVLYKRLPSYWLRRYYPTKQVLYPVCGDLTQRHPLRYPRDPAYKRLDRHTKWRSIRKFCRSMRNTVRKGEPKGKHASVPCSRMRLAQGDGDQLTLHYRCWAGHPHAARIITLVKRLTIPDQLGGLQIFRYKRRNCNPRVKEVQIVNGIWSRKRPRSDSAPTHK